MAQIRLLAGVLAPGHFGTGDAVMPGLGRGVERPDTLAELTAMSDAFRPEEVQHFTDTARRIGAIYSDPSGDAARRNGATQNS